SFAGPRFLPVPERSRPQRNHSSDPHRQSQLPYAVTAVRAGGSSPSLHGTVRNTAPVADVSHVIQRCFSHCAVVRAKGDRPLSPACVADGDRRAAQAGDQDGRADGDVGGEAGVAFVGGFAQGEGGRGGALGWGEALAGAGGLDGAVVLGEGGDRVDDAPADQAVAAGDGAFRGLLDLGGDLTLRPLGVLGLDERGDARDVGRGEAGAVVEAVAALGDGGDHVDAGCGHVDEVAGLGEGRAFVVAVGGGDREDALVGGGVGLLDVASGAV